MFKKILFFVLFFISFYNYSFADNLSLSIEGGTTRNVFYGQTETIIATATFPEGCSSTGITWTTTTGSFPFFSTITLGTGESYSSGFTSNLNITVTATCDGMNEATFVSINIKSPEVSAGLNTSYNSGDIVNLSGSIIGTPCSVFDYTWEQISGPAVEITHSGANEINSNTYHDASFVFPDSTESIIMKLNVTPKSCIHAGNTYSGIVTYSKTISSGGGGGRSYSSKMREEAEKLFSDSGSIDKMNVELKLDKINSPFLYFHWNNIGGNGQVEYFLEYSTGAKFYNYKTLKTTEIFQNFTENDLDYLSLIHYFRVKACYLGKCSKYSNTVKYYSEDYLPFTCNKNKKLVKFEDIFLDSNSLIEDNFSIKCKNCKK